MGVSGDAGPTNVSADTGDSGSNASVTGRSPLGTGQDNASIKSGKGTSTTETNVYDPFDGFHNSTVTETPSGTTVVDSHAPPPPPPNQL